MEFSKTNLSPLVVAKVKSDFRSLTTDFERFSRLCDGNERCLLFLDDFKNGNVSHVKAFVNFFESKFFNKVLVHQISINNTKLLALSRLFRCKILSINLAVLKSLNEKDNLRHLTSFAELTDTYQFVFQETELFKTQEFELDKILEVVPITENTSSRIWINIEDCDNIMKDIEFNTLKSQLLSLPNVNQLIVTADGSQENVGTILKRWFSILPKINLVRLSLLLWNEADMTQLIYYSRFLENVEILIDLNLKVEFNLLAGLVLLARKLAMDLKFSKFIHTSNVPNFGDKITVKFILSHVFRQDLYRKEGTYNFASFVACLHENIGRGMSMLSSHLRTEEFVKFVERYCTI